MAPQRRHSKLAQPFYRQKKEKFSLKRRVFCYRQSVETAGAFWKQLPDSVVYEATIPLTYQTKWLSQSYEENYSQVNTCPIGLDMYQKTRNATRD